MKSYFDKNAYCDADGNRGIPVWEYELEPSDEPEILAQLWDELWQYSLEGYRVADLPKVTVTIAVCDDYHSDDVEFEITPSDYISAEEWEKFCKNEEEKDKE